MIRLEGAEVLCDAVRNNIHLVHLDLSYNALGSAATCILGASLMENKVVCVFS
jgi:Ran GTPase-activating protein (RanGAP) involved in mRNA processing and transport